MPKGLELVGAEGFELTCSEIGVPKLKAGNEAILERFGGLGTEGAPKGLVVEELEGGFEVAGPEAGEPKLKEGAEGFATEGSPKGLVAKGLEDGFDVAAVLVCPGGLGPNDGDPAGVVEKIEG